MDRYAGEINKLIGENRINRILFNNKKPTVDLIKKYEKQEGKNSLVLWGKEKKEFKVIKARGLLPHLVPACVANHAHV